MTGTEYQRLAMRTAGNYASDWDQINNAVLGLSGEVGEVADAFKKYSYQGHQFDQDKLIDEISDIEWYAALACDALGTTLDEVFQHNVDKLKKRYPDGFKAEDSINREEYKNAK